jgi:ubiquinone/menaquinone biosynthesis C-methylase UbiE
VGDTIGVVKQPDPGRLPDGVRDDGVFSVVVEGYDVVYPAVAASPTFRKLWAEHACGGAFPSAFAHISFLTFDELRAMAAHLALGEDAVLADLACGAGGPGLWVAAQSGASLIGIDPSSAGLAEARKRSKRVGIAHRARYQKGTFAATGIGGSAADAALSVDAIQYAPDKRQVFSEAHRILRAGGRFAFSAFEVDPQRVDGLPVLGIDPVPDYAPLLEGAGFAIDWYIESAGWSERVQATFGAVVQAMATLTGEMGQAAASSLGMEAAVTLQVQPYRRRVVVAAHRLDG